MALIHHPTAHHTGDGLGCVQITQRQTSREKDRCANCGRARQKICRTRGADRVCAAGLGARTAPRSGGLWDEVRGQIRSSINQSGGLVEEAEGPFGPELRAQVKSSDGSAGLQPARFTGIEGPRWFLRAVFLGAAAKPGECATALESMIRSLVVVRGGEAMPVGAPIPLVLPTSPGAAAADAPTLPSPFERGPEITEIR